MTQTFTEDSQFIGFYGAVASNELQALGFLAQDMLCSAQQSNDSEGGSGDDNKGDDAVAIMGVFFGCLAAAVIAAIICLVAKERNQAMNKIQVISKPEDRERQESEMGLSAVPSRGEAVTITAESDIDGEMFYGDKNDGSRNQADQMSSPDDFGNIPKVKINKLGANQVNGGLIEDNDISE